MKSLFELHHGESRSQRAIRHNANLKASLIIPFESWQLLWPLQTIDISESDVFCRYTVSDEKEAIHAMELSDLLDAQPEVHLQIDAPSTDIFSPSVEAVLIKKSIQSNALDLEFRFLSLSQDIECLVSSLADRAQGHFEKTSRN